VPSALGLPRLAAERPEVFNAYQQTQGDKLEKVMETMKAGGYVASFIGHEPGKAVFVGLYSISGSKRLTYEQYWQIPALWRDEVGDERLDCQPRSALYSLV
jgi:hypothetical protein